MIVSVHQPEFFPWLGFFHKLSIADKFVLLDNVQFKKNNFQNRNQICVSGQANWVSMPIKKASMHTLIQDIEIAWHEERHINKLISKILSAYKKTPYFNLIFPIIEDLFTAKPKKLVDFNFSLIKTIAKLLGIETKILLASELPLPAHALKGSELLLEIVTCLKGEMYISGSGGRNYLDVNLFLDNDIEVYFQEFNHPMYHQATSENFISNLSTVDLLFNAGKDCMEIIEDMNISKSELAQLELQLD